jgi:predicted nucleotidyltransferase
LSYFLRVCFKNEGVNREQAMAKLRDYEPQLKAIGVVSASLFGSVARDDAGVYSDVDVAVKLSEGFSTGGFDYFWQLEQLERRPSGLLGCQVDMVAESLRKERLQSEIDRDRALAF